MSVPDPRWDRQARQQSLDCAQPRKSARLTRNKLRSVPAIRHVAFDCPSLDLAIHAALCNFCLGLKLLLPLLWGWPLGMCMLTISRMGQLGKGAAVSQQLLSPAPNLVLQTVCSSALPLLPLVLHAEGSCLTLLPD